MSKCNDTCKYYKNCWSRGESLIEDGEECVLYEPDRPHGEWIDESKDALKCSSCGKWVYKPFIGGFPTDRTQHYNPNYCAFCGADMREGDPD